ncbi:unnamed protein product [Penicillium egyptiacum]|uniref:acetate--CoA ligase n=1 Tax=Penicillium egyptiacum TaxID=1303716 RepID=A0A9W4KGQ9_9EURO|nr:unnamed protein product [Penicillium egyptiacum]
MTAFNDVRQDNDVGRIPVPTSYQLKHPSVPHLKDHDEYSLLYQKSIEHPREFWSEMATASLKWEIFFDQVHHGTFETGDHGWFIGGKLNACYNCVDRHAFTDPDRLAILYERDMPDSQPQQITYGQLLIDVSRLSWVLKDMGVQKGDIVSIYMPNIPEAVIAMLSCARIGAVHSVVFAGFSAPSLRGRLNDACSRVILTVDEGVRGGKIIPMKRVVEDALADYEGDKVQCLVLRKTGSPVPWCQRSKDIWWHEECGKWPGYYEPVSMRSEDPLFMLYTSGSTGKPKGLMHTTAGYLLGCAVSGKYVLDLHLSDTMFCAGDGLQPWCSKGPSFPDYDRFWQVLERCKATHFYTAPTSLRMIKKSRPDGSTTHLGRLRVVASIGEPLAPSVWQWCYEVLGNREVHVLDTYFQTETGCHAFSPLAGITPTKAGTVSLPFFGFRPALIDADSGNEIVGDNINGLLVFKQPWPSIARTVWRDHARYMNTYFESYQGKFTTGDGACRDRDGYYQIMGRVDDVVNISGHRLSTAEIESTLLDHGSFAEVAVVGIPDEMTGQALVVFLCLKNNVVTDQVNLKSSARQHVEKSIGRFAVPKQVLLVSDLPKTRSGKIMRRILRKILDGEKGNLGDTSTLLRPCVVSDIIGEVTVQTTTESCAMTPDDKSSLSASTSLTHSPYPFSPYNLSFLDHILPPCHIFMFLSFNNASIEGIDALRTGVTRLCEKFPFLTGLAVPSSQSAGKEGVLEVQPASSNFLERYPMLQVAHSPGMDEVSRDDFIQQQYLPIPFLIPPTEPMPLVRFKANVTRTMIILSVAYFHRALDSTGVSVVLKTLSELCKNQDATSTNVLTNSEAEESSRQHLTKFKASQPLPFNWTLVPLSFDTTPAADPSRIPISRHFSLNPQKVTFLKDACNGIIKSLAHGDSKKPNLVTSNDIITALVGLCGNKARLEVVPESVQSPKVIIPANVRKQCQLPANYMGNALVAVESDYDTFLLPEEMVLQSFPASLDQKQLGHPCSIAISLRKEISDLTEGYLQGILRTISDSNSFSSFFPAYGSSIIVSSLRWMDFYLDFGALGKVQRYDIPENKVKGVCWVLPARDLGGDINSQPFELRFVLERAAMERLQEDNLFQWVLTD